MTRLVFAIPSVFICYFKSFAMVYDGNLYRMRYYFYKIVFITFSCSSGLSNEGSTFLPSGFYRNIHCYLVLCELVLLFTSLCL